MVRLFVIEFSFTPLKECLTHIDISFVLSGNGETGQSPPPVTLHLAITVWVNRTSPSDFPNIPTQGDKAPAEGVPNPTMTPDSRESDQSTAPEPPLSLPDYPPVQSSTPISQDLSETSLVEKTRLRVDRAVQAEKSIDGSNTWQGVVEKIKWVMNTLSPVAGVRVIDIIFCLSSPEPTCFLSSIRLHRWRMECFQ